MVKSPISREKLMALVQDDERFAHWFSRLKPISHQRYYAEMILALKKQDEIISALREIVKSLAARVGAQSEILSRVAERSEVRHG